MELPTAEVILAMPPGPEMDELIHALVLNLPKKGRVPKYSTDYTKAVEIVLHHPVSVGQINPESGAYKSDRPFWGGDPDTIVVTADGPAKALCKAILLMLVDKQTKARSAAPAPADEAAAAQ